MTPSGSRVVQLQHKIVFKTNYEPCLLYGIFNARLSSDTTATPQGFDTSQLWVPRGHVALASAVLEGILTECGPINGFLCTGNSSEFEDLHGQLLSTSTPHPRRRPELEPPECCTRFNILPLDLTNSTPTNNNGALQVECRISSNLKCSRKGRIFADDELERHRAYPSIKTSVDEPSDVPSHARALSGTALSS